MALRLGLADRSLHWMLPCWNSDPRSDRAQQPRLRLREMAWYAPHYCGHFLRRHCEFLPFSLNLSWDD